MPSEEVPGGELSQDDIDSMLGGGVDGAEGEAGGVESPAGDAGVPLSQADIDAALSGATQDASESPDPPKDERLDSAGRPFDDIAAAMAEAIEDAKPAAGDGSAENPLGTEFEASAGAERTEKHIDLLEDVELNVKIELGRTRMLIEDVLQLGNGSVVELDKLAGDPVDVLVNDRLVARGEVLVLNDNFCVRVNEIISQTGEAIRS